MSTELYIKVTQARLALLKAINESLMKQGELWEFTTRLEQVKNWFEREIYIGIMPDDVCIEFAGNVDICKEDASRLLKALLVRAGVLDANEDIDIPDCFTPGSGDGYAVDGGYWFCIGLVYEDSDDIHTIDEDSNITAYDPEHFQEYANSFMVKMNGEKFRGMFDDDLIRLYRDDGELIDFQDANNCLFDDILDDIRNIVGGIGWVSTDAWRGAHTSPPDVFEAFGKEWTKFDSGFVSLDGWHGDKNVTEKDIDNMKDVILVFTRTSNCCTIGIDMYVPVPLK